MDLVGVGATLDRLYGSDERLVARYSPECMEKLFGNSQARANLLTIRRIMAA